VMTVCLLGSIAAAIHCLQSRLLTRSQLAQLVSAEDRATGNVSPYRPEQSWFFQILAPLDRERLERTLQAVDAAFEIEALSTRPRFRFAGASYVAGILL